MSGRRNWSDIRRPGNPHLEQGFGAAIDAGLWLPELRRQAGLTQEQVAERLRVTQSWISQMEHQTDIQLSTLAAYVAALGGTVRLAASLPGGREVDLSYPPPARQDVAAAGRV
jgi:transcriptional regulator with XRE-family HTH domain